MGGLPRDWGEWSALFGILALVVGAFGWIGRIIHRDITSRIEALRRDGGAQIADCLAQIRVISDWQQEMKDDHLPKTYARKDEVALQLRGLEQGQTRIEASMKDVKTDMVNAVNEVKSDNRETIHAFRNDLIKLLQPLHRLPRRRGDPLDTDYSG